MRWVFRILSALVVLVLLAGAALFLIPSEKIAKLAAGEFARTTGRTLTIEGAVKPTLWPVLGVKTGAVAISNADWASDAPLLQAEGLVIGLDMSALFGGAVQITELVATKPVILLERAKDGRGNWEFEMAGQAAGADAGAGAAAGPNTFTLAKGVIKEGTLSYIDHASGQRAEVTQIMAETAIPDFNGPVDLGLSGVMNGQSFAAKAHLAEFAPFIDGKVVALSLTSTIGAARVGFEGRAGFAPLMAEGKLDADLADLGAVAALAGGGKPAVPQGFGAKSVTVKGALTVTDQGSVHLRGAQVGLDGNMLSGDADLTSAGARPKLSAKIAAGALDFSGSGAGGAGDTQGALSGVGWSKDTIDVSGLGAMDAAVALTAQSIDLGNAKLGATKVLVTNDRSRAVFDLRQVQAYGGTIKGQLVVNGRKGLSMAADLVVAGLAMQPLLADVAGYDRLTGTGDISAKVLASGTSMDALMHSLSGDGRLAFGKGALRGLDLAGMLRTLDAGYVGEGAKTIFESVTGSFVIKNGVLANDDMALVAPLVTAVGKGTVGLGAQVLEYRVTPTALAKADGSGGLRVPLLITGPWAKPKFKLDMETLAQEKLAIERAKLEARAAVEAKRLKAEAKAKLADELGVVQQQGENLEDAAKRRANEAVQEEATRALGRLLGGN